MSSTIIDIARDCGYSKATVSRAFAKPEAVSPKAREKIYASAKKLNYAPNVIARAMVTRRTENIAFIIHEKQYPAILNPFYSPILETVLQEANRRNYSLFIGARQDMLLPNNQFSIKRQMDGVIFAGEVDKPLIQALRAQSIPVVLLNNHWELEGLPCVEADHFAGAVEATRHLVRRGHTRIWLMAGLFSKQVREARFQGFRSVLNEAGLPLDTRFVKELEPTLEVADAEMTRLLGEGDCPTAFFCTNDTIAVGAMKAILRAGRRIPQDIALVGFDDSYLSRVVEPGLTTIRVDPERMGRIASEKLFAMIDGGEGAGEIIRLKPELIQRGTT
ncbi:MAG: LacI family DNA-binding transcriptional regulator [Clostridia bacterium]|nr:LacI family DNA-binding transcriptional regulator [Clostridia bacterium]